MSRILTGEVPKTEFLDELDELRVVMLSYPDPEMTKKVIINVCYGYDKPNIYDSLTESERDKAIQDVVNEGTLPKALEMIGKFVFLVENISLTVTHCLVRHRFFTILQSSTGVSDLRNEKFVMPRSFNKNKYFYSKVKKWYLEGKELFVEGIDNQGLSVQNARLLLPKNNCNHMFIGFDLKSFKDAYAQRVDTQEEIIQNNVIFLKMKDLIVEKFSYLKGMFKSACETGQCLHSKQGKHANVVFKRDELHKKFLPKDYKLEDETLHNLTRDEMNKGNKIITEKYIGLRNINQSELKC